MALNFCSESQFRVLCSLGFPQPHLGTLCALLGGFKDNVGDDGEE